YVFDDVKQEFRLRATYGLDDTVVAELRNSHIGIGRQLAISEAVKRRVPIQVPDIQNDPSATLDVIVRAGFRALLIVPILSTGGIVGALVGRRKQPGEFQKRAVELLQTFAEQSVLAIQNARLFESVEARTCERLPRWRTCAPRKTAWCRRRSWLRLVNSLQASHTRSRTHLISSTISL